MVQNNIREPCNLQRLKYTQSKNIYTLHPTQRSRTSEKSIQQWSTWQQTSSSELVCSPLEPRIATRAAFFQRDGKAPQTWLTGEWKELARRLTMAVIRCERYMRSAVRWASFASNQGDKRPKAKRRHRRRLICLVCRQCAALSLPWLTFPGTSSWRSLTDPTLRHTVIAMPLGLTRVPFSSSSSSRTIFFILAWLRGRENFFFAI